MPAERFSLRPRLHLGCLFRLVFGQESSSVSSVVGHPVRLPKTTHDDAECWARLSEDHRRQLAALLARLCSLPPLSPPHPCRDWERRGAVAACSPRPCLAIAPGTAAARSDLDRQKTGSGGCTASGCTGPRSAGCPRSPRQARAAAGPVHRRPGARAPDARAAASPPGGGPSCRGPSIGPARPAGSCGSGGQWA
jgi:hypothetical protein